MSQLTDNLNLIASIKSDISAAIEAKGVSMSGVSFGSYADKIGEIPTGGQFVTEPLSVSVNGTYTPGQGVDGYSQVTVDVPQSVTGFTEKEITEQTYAIYNLNNSASFVHRNVFEDDDNLLTVNLPNASYVGSEAFKLCDGLTRVNLPVCEIIYSTAFQNCSSLSEVSLPVCRSIENNAFYACRDLRSINLPACNIVQSGTFQYCSSLSEVNLPACNSLGNSVFAYCSSLSVVNLPVCNSLGNYVFANCSSLTSLTIGTKTYIIPSYQNRIFSNATNMLTGSGSIYVASDMYSRWIVASGWSSLSSRFVSVDQSGPVLSFESGVVSGITGYASKDLMTYLNISSNDIVEVYLPDCIKVNGNTFDGCSSLTTVNLPVCSYISGNTFYICTSLSEVNLPACMSIGNNAFTGCSSLSEVNLPVCSYIESYVFDNCKSLSNISLPLCEHIGKNAFMQTGLVNISLPLCKEILTNTFRSCYSLTRVDLPICSNIESLAFYSCSNLSILFLRSNNVCSMKFNTFQGTYFWNNSGSIYVPASLVDAYKSTYTWMENICLPIPE
jgi:hypothetical protein